MPAPDALGRLLGLAARAGALVPGTERVREAARAGQLRFAVLAADASGNSREKLVPLLEARRIPYVMGPDRADLGAAVGRPPLSAVGLTVASFATRARQLAAGGSE